MKGGGKRNDEFSYKIVGFEVMLENQVPGVQLAVGMVEVEFREKVLVGDKNVKVMCIKMDDVSGVEKRNEA